MEGKKLKLGNLLESVVLVRPQAQGGARSEVMEIGHSKTSKTFMTQIETVAGQTYCDCPGFLDSRGAEINIANAVNVRNAITSAKSIRALMLLNYASLKADRGRGLKDMLKIASNLFGSADNLLRYKDSLYIGITNAPPQQGTSVELLRDFIIDETFPITQTLAERVCVFDPLDRPIAGGWDLATFKQKIGQLKSITKHAKMFSTVLTDEDENVLMNISEEIAGRIDRSFKNHDYPRAAADIKRLRGLGVIAHPTIARLQEKNLRITERAFRDWESTIKEHCNLHQFEMAAAAIQQLDQALKLFDQEVQKVISVARLQTYSAGRQQQHAETLKKAREMREEIESQKHEIGRLMQLLQEQRDFTKTQLEEQEGRFKEMLATEQQNREKTQKDYQEQMEALRSEMTDHLARKEQELALSHFSKEEAAQKLEEAQKAYEERVRKLEEEKETALKQQADAQRTREQAQQREQEATRKQLAIQDQELKIKAQEKERAEKKAKEDAEEQARAEQETKHKAEEQKRQAIIPATAFGAEKWRKYYGDVGAAPAIPKNLLELYTQDCKLWPGKKVYDTHLLTLIPATVGGKPLTLNSFRELMKNPQGSGHAVRDYEYYDDLKKELGDKPAPASHWALMTRDVIEGSKSKSYDDQRKWVAQQAQKFNIPYTLTAILDGVASVLCHHAETGVKLLPDAYSRASESLQDGQRCAFFGNFGADGLNVCDRILVPWSRPGVCAALR